MSILIAIVLLPIKNVVGPTSKCYQIWINLNAKHIKQSAGNGCKHVRPIRNFGFPRNGNSLGIAELLTSASNVLIMFLDDSHLCFGSFERLFVVRS